MKEIILTYMTDYSQKRTRPFAFALMLDMLEQFRQQMDEQDRRYVFGKIDTFSTAYDKAWFWQKKNVLIETIRGL